MKVWQQYRYESVQSVKVQLKHWQLCVEKSAEVELIDNLPQYGKAQSFVLQEQEQEARNKVHALAVVKCRVDYSISIEDASQILIVYLIIVLERPTDINFDIVLDSLWQVKQ